MNKLRLPPGIQLLGFNPGDSLALPLLMPPVPAGFPSPAADYIDQHLDLNDHLVANPSSTFFVRVTGESMADDHIHPGDILVVDRAQEAASGRIVIAVIDGDFTVKRLRMNNGRTFLEPANPSFDAFEVPPESDFQIWGVVTFIIHKA